ncbi:MAG TPA: MBL fold metallo-hydrolase [Candidatus Babeliales bacterium]|nr:MBL fold metallo-hydrolase [Candidatus Babeliales bacterium]
MRTPFRCLISVSAVAALCIPAIELNSAKAQSPTTKVASSAQIRALKITVLSTMLVGDTVGLGEWGFSALVEADGRRILLDTGNHPETVLQNVRDLNIDLSDVKDVILTHDHLDHVGGLMPLRREMMKKNKAALSVAHVGRGIFYSRPSPEGEQNAVIAIRKDYEASGGNCIEHAEGFDIFPGAWLTGPVPRKYPEHNWSPGGKVQTPSGLVEDNIPEDQSLVLNTSRGLVVLTGCGHAGIINILTYAKQRFPNQPVYGVVGGLHLFAASDEQLNWTGGKLKDFKVANLLGAHCTGIEAVYRLRERAGLTRQSAVVGSVGSVFTLGEGIRPGMLAR